MNLIKKVRNKLFGKTYEDLKVGDVFYSTVIGRQATFVKLRGGNFICVEADDLEIIGEKTSHHLLDISCLLFDEVLLKESKSIQNMYYPRG